MAMWMIDSCQFTGGYLIDFAFDRLNESWVLYRRVNRDIFLGFDGWVWINADDCLCPFFKFRHFLSWKLITIACDMNRAVIIDNKLSIFISPSVDFKPLLFISNRFTAFDVFLGKTKCKIIQSLHFMTRIINIISVLINHILHYIFI